MPTQVPSKAVNVSRDVVHPRTWNAFRDACCDLAIVRNIERVFENEGLYRAPDVEAKRPSSTFQYRPESHSSLWAN